MLNCIDTGEISMDFLKTIYLVILSSQISLLDQNNKFTHKIKRMTDFCERTKISSVPDPYYGASQGFETVIDILEDSCGGFLKYLKSNKQ